MSDAPPAPTGDAQQNTASDVPASAETRQPTETPTNGPSSDSDIKDPYQPLHVFLAPSGTVPAAALAALPETDIVPTIAHAQLHQSRLQESSRNKRLLSDKELEDKAAAEEARLSAIKSVIVKVRFPDNMSSDWEVGPNETGAFLYEAVRHVMASPGQPFHLVLPGDRTVIKDDNGAKHNLVRGYKLSGRVLVSLVWEDAVPADVRGKPFLKSNVAQKGQAVKAPEAPREVEEKPSSSAAPPEPPKPERSGDGAGKKIPKWLKLGKK